MKEQNKTTKAGKLLPDKICPVCKRDLTKTGHDAFCSQVYS